MSWFMKNGGYSMKHYREPRDKHYKEIKRTNLHHRRSRCRAGGKETIYGIPNLIRVDERRHQAFHLVFADTHPKAIANELNAVWADPAWQIIAIPKDLVKEVRKVLPEL